MVSRFISNRLGLGSGLGLEINSLSRNGVSSPTPFLRAEGILPFHDRVVISNRIFEFRLLHKEHVSDIEFPHFMLRAEFSGLKE
jgi:hypothetical protein